MTFMPVSTEDPESVDLLIVEDDDGFAAMLDRIFAENPDYATRVSSVNSLSAALEVVEGRQVDAVLLDLGLPDSDGLRTARRMTDAVREPTAVVVFTAMRDQSLASQALELGVQDYVVKEDMTSHLVTRVVKYGVTRARLVHELQVAKQGEARERELRRMERMASEGRTTSVSASMLGDHSVADRLGSRYVTELVEEYSRIVRRSLDEQAYRGDNMVDDDLRSLAGVLGFLGAGPRDVIELHTNCMRRLVRELDSTRATATLEEGRVMVLQLMGRLVAHYRDRSIGSRGSGQRGPSTPEEKAGQ